MISLCHRKKGSFTCWVAVQGTQDCICLLTIQPRLSSFPIPSSGIYSQNTIQVNPFKLVKLVCRDTYDFTAFLSSA